MRACPLGSASCSAASAISRGRIRWTGDESERERGRGYYTGLALRITALDGTLELGDGGLTDWAARLTGDAKERCLVSCLATERLVACAASG